VPLGGPGGAVADPVADDDLDPGPVVGDFDLHLPAARIGFDPVADRVLDQRLQAQRGKPGAGEHVRSHQNLPALLEPRAQPQPLDLEVAPGERQLLAERDQPGARQRGAEQVGKVQQEPLRRLGLAVDQGDPGVERVEQEVGADARLQRLELGLLGADRELAVAPVGLEGGQRHQPDGQRHDGQRQGQRRPAPGGPRPDVVQEQPGEAADDPGAGDQRDQCELGDADRAGAGKPPPGEEEHGHGHQGDPLDRERGHAEPGQPVAGQARAEREHEGQRLARQDDADDRPGFPERVQRSEGGAWLAQSERSFIRGRRAGVPEAV
jgi:hypothetical protein